MKIKEIVNEEISQLELNQVESFADKLWNKLGIDVQFTKHFIERLNDERNGKPITTAELIRLFKKEYESYGKRISNLSDAEAVLKDLTTEINLPFIIKDIGNDKTLVAKTIMRKADFKTPDPEFVVR